MAGPGEILEPGDEFTKPSSLGWPSKGSSSGRDPEIWDYSSGPQGLTLVFLPTRQGLA